ncbi:MAG TPA: TMEM175 family protein [Jatrophihabitantaceae bacterium]|nr:TMEM175 family protein [Jatrophihabitantaceae bacterium]
MADKPSRSSKLRTARMEAFSDGVYAIAITLLILDVTIPPNSGEHLLRAYLDQWPSFLAYVASFATIGASWLGHSLVTEYLEQADPILVRLNLILLFVISLIPFPTRVVGEYVTERHAERVAITIYGIHLLVATLLLSALWRYAARQRLIHPDRADVELRLLSRRVEPGLIGYVVLIGVGLLFPIVSLIGYLALAITVILPIAALHRIQNAKS